MRSAAQGVPMAAVCKDADLQSFPTWIIDGQKLEGEQSFAKLRSLLPAARPAAAAQ